MILLARDPREISAYIDLDRLRLSIPLATNTPHVISGPADNSEHTFAYLGKGYATVIISHLEYLDGRAKPGT